MTTETPDEGYAKFKANNDAYWAAHPAELAEIEAKGDAMQARAEVYERALVGQRTAIKALAQTADGAHMLACIANVIALEHLRCAALGIRAVPSWQKALERNRVMTAATIEARNPTFQRETN